MVTALAPTVCLACLTLLDPLSSTQNFRLKAITPSEAVYAELHASLPAVLEQSYRAKVWIVSPTTLMATLNTIRAVLKDVQMREQADVIQVEVFKMIEDVGRLDDRVAKLQRHMGQTDDDLRQIRISTDKVTRRSERITEVEMGENIDTSGITEPPKARLVDDI